MSDPASLTREVSRLWFPIGLVAVGIGGFELAAIGFEVAHVLVDAIGGQLPGLGPGLRIGFRILAISVAIPMAWGAFIGWRGFGDPAKTLLGLRWIRRGWTALAILSMLAAVAIGLVRSGVFAG